ncbi:MAG: succinate dehydrogenase cytochrome b subunit [Saprospiraceae bacterium]
MSWISEFLTSSIGKKLVMSLTGLFLIIFLLVHLTGNLQLLIPDEGKAFNIYADFMSNNPLIKVISLGLYAGILLHAIQGILIAWNNKKAKGQSYAVSTYENGSWMSKNMGLLGLLIFAFLAIHMGDFWVKVRFTDSLEMVSYPGWEHELMNVYKRVNIAFSNIWIVIIYLIGLLALSLHLMHGFKSAFTTLGLEHRKYSPLIKWIGIGYAILIPIGYAIIPLFMFFSHQANY